MVSLVATCLTSLEKIIVICLCPALGYLFWDGLHLDVPWELAHQGCLLRDGIRQICNLLGHVLISIEWKSSDDGRLSK